MAIVRDERKKGREEEYFHRKEQEALEITRQRLAADETERHQRASLMCCPKCGEKLVEVVFQEITIDRCNGCQGVWLDPGELERVTAKESRGWLARFWRSTSA